MLMSRLTVSEHVDIVQPVLPENGHRVVGNKHPTERQKSAQEERGEETCNGRGWRVGSDELSDLKRIT
jgi:hypothetical protein